MRNFINLLLVIILAAFLLQCSKDEKKDEIDNSDGIDDNRKTEEFANRFNKDQMDEFMQPSNAQDIYNKFILYAESQIGYETSAPDQDYVIVSVSDNAKLGTNYGYELVKNPNISSNYDSDGKYIRLALMSDFYNGTHSFSKSGSPNNQTTIQINYLLKNDKEVDILKFKIESTDQDLVNIKKSEGTTWSNNIEIFNRNSGDDGDGEKKINIQLANGKTSVNGDFDPGDKVKCYLIGQKEDGTEIFRHMVQVRLSEIPP